MATYKMKIAYDGTRYNGWQRQKNTPDTIQSKLERCLGEIIGTSVEIQGAGRTDAGVHALAQTASFCTDCPIDLENTRLLLCGMLPRDIAVLSLEPAAERFHARFNSKGKIYRYRICTSAPSPVFMRNYVFHHPQPLDISTVINTAPLLCGTHDYAVFCGNPHMKKSTVRTVDSIEVKQWSDDAGNAFVDLIFSGDGFLYHMVRLMTGVLIYHGEHPTQRLPEIWNIAKLPENYPLAPAKGLTLVEVIY